MSSRTESRPTLPVPAEPGIPAHAPESAKAIAFALDRVTGGDGRFVYSAAAARVRRGCLAHPCVIRDSIEFDTTADLHKFLEES